MCFSFEVSLGTFIIGTLLTLSNIKKFSNSNIFSALNISWFAAISMQLWEAMIWKKLECKTATAFAKWNNILQPLIFCIVLNHFGVLKHKLVISIMIGAYLLYAWKALNKDYGCIYNENGIHLSWWNDINPKIYFVLIPIILALVIPDKKLLFLQILYYSVSLWAASALYPCHEGQIGSIWCFFASFVPLYNRLLYNNLN